MRCPWCKQSDGNDDIIVGTKILYLNSSICGMDVTKQCDICGKKYTLNYELKVKTETLIDPLIVK